MPLRYNDAQRRAYLNFIDGVAVGWVDIFEGDTEFYSAAYWDLLRMLWRAETPPRKTEALRSMTGIKSPLTAAKYIDTAMTRGYVVEMDNPADARSKLLDLAPATRSKMDGFFDGAVEQLRVAARRVDVLGPSPDVG